MSTTTVSKTEDLYNLVDTKLKKAFEKQKQEQNILRRNQKRVSESQQNLEKLEFEIKNLNKQKKNLKENLELMADSKCEESIIRGVIVKGEPVEVIDVDNDKDAGGGGKVKAEPVEVIEIDDEDVEDDDDDDKKPNSMKDDDSHKSDGEDDYVKASSYCNEEIPPGKKKASDESKDSRRENSSTTKKQSAAKIALERDADDNKYKYCDKAQAEELARPKAEHIKKRASAAPAATRAKKKHNSSAVEESSKNEVTPGTAEHVDDVESKPAAVEKQFGKDFFQTSSLDSIFKHLHEEVGLGPGEEPPETFSEMRIDSTAYRKVAKILRRGNFAKNLNYGRHVFDMIYERKATDLECDAFLFCCAGDSWRPHDPQMRKGSPFSLVTGVSSMSNEFYTARVGFWFNRECDEDFDLERMIVDNSV